MRFKRRKLGRAKSKRMFRRNAVKVHRKNVRLHPMRGGIRT